MKSNKLNSTKPPKPTIQPSTLGLASYDEIKASVHEKIKAMQCPHCEIHYSDWSIKWMDQRMEKRSQRLKKRGINLRDGNVKLKCELCLKMAWTTALWTPPTKTRLVSKRRLKLKPAKTKT